MVFRFRAVRTPLSPSFLSFAPISIVSLIVYSSPKSGLKLAKGSKHEFSVTR